MTNYERYISKTIEQIADQSIYTVETPDYDEGLDGEWFCCGSDTFYRSTLHNREYWSREDAIEWLKAEEGWETLCCEMCVGYDRKSGYYGFTGRCKGCAWYAWADENDPKNVDKWERCE